MARVETEYSGGAGLDKYSKLSKSGFSVHILIEPGERKLVIEGLTARSKISKLQHHVYETEGIHHANQRLFLAGEELDPGKTLAHYHVFADCLLQLKSFLPVLVSSLECPGPMLTEIEVLPKYDEAVRNVKLRLSDKLGIDVDRQRLYLAADEMTSFPRRRELDDASLLSRYLSPSFDGNFIELRPKTDSDHQSGQVITFKVPIMVQDARKSDFTAFLETSDALHESPTTLPHTYHKKMTDGWLSLELSTEKVIRRDPLVSDIVKILMENIKPSGEESGADKSCIKLKFVKNRQVHGGEYLCEDRKCNEAYQIRGNEELLKVEIDGNETPESGKIPTISVPKPLQPMTSYNEKGTRYTTPKSPTVFKWTIPPTEELDLGANPSVFMEISAFSHSRLCGSWDVAEHYKTYVELFIEGTFYVGDTMATNAVMESGTSLRDKKRSAISYSQDWMEITIFGPENDKLPTMSMVNTNPMRWYRKSAESKKKDKEFWEQTLDRRLGYAPPFRYDIRPINLPKRTGVENKDGIFTHSGHSRLFVNNWYAGKEKITSIMPKTHKGPAQIFDARCERGTTISGSPYVKILFQSRNQKILCEERCTAFDFRIQTQFYVCTLEEEFVKETRPDNPKRFSISAKQQITRTKYIPHFSPEDKQLTSPATKQMQTTLAIDLANGAWMKEARKAEDI